MLKGKYDIGIPAEYAESALIERLSTAVSRKTTLCMLPPTVPVARYSTLGYAK
jgi:hypothetical protein